MNEHTGEERRMSDDSRAKRDCDAVLLWVYSVLFTDCIYESAYATMSLHKTKQGAVEAMMKLKIETFYGKYPHDFNGFRYGKQVILD